MQGAWGYLGCQYEPFALSVFRSRRKSGVWSTATAKCGTTAIASCQITLVSDAGRAGTAAIAARHNAGGVAKNVYLSALMGSTCDTTMYGYWRIPDHVAVSNQLHGLTAMIRYSSTAVERANNKRRIRALRTTPPTDVDWKSLFGGQEYTESMHNNMKEKWFDRRVCAVDKERRELQLRDIRFTKSSPLSRCGMTESGETFLDTSVNGNHPTETPNHAHNVMVVDTAWPNTRSVSVLPAHWHFSRFLPALCRR